MLSFVDSISATILLQTQNGMTPAENMVLDLYKTGITFTEISFNLYKLNEKI